MVLIVLPRKGQPLVRQPSQEDRQGFVEDGAGARWINPEVVQLIGSDAASDTQFQPSA